MQREELTTKILDIKREKGWSWAHIHRAIGDLSPILLTAALLGQMRLPKVLAARAAELFGLTAAEGAMLTEPPSRGSPMPPSDPLVYRFYELVMVYGSTFKALIEEEFGDGIMSAIDFDMALERQPNPKGDRVRITLSASSCLTNITATARGFRSTATRNDGRGSDCGGRRLLEWE